MDRDKIYVGVGIFLLVNMFISVFMFLSKIFSWSTLSSMDKVYSVCAIFIFIGSILFLILLGVSRDSDRNTDKAKVQSDVELDALRRDVERNYVPKKPSVTDLTDDVSMYVKPRDPDIPRVERRVQEPVFRNDNYNSNDEDFRW